MAVYKDTTEYSRTQDLKKVMREYIDWIFKGKTDPEYSYETNIQDMYQEFSYITEQLRKELDKIKNENMKG